MANQESVTGKEPWLAVILSGIFPGMGQIYAGQTSRGWLLIFIGLILIGLGGWFVLSPAASIRLGIQLLIGYSLLTIFNLFDAYRCTKKSNSREFENLRKTDKDPWLGVFLSRIIPGLGHLYQGQWIFALLFFLLIFGTGILSAAFPIISLVAMGLLYFCFYHAYISSPSVRAKSKSLIIGICLALFAIDLCSLSLREFVAEARYIPAGSMLPTLEINDRIIINKLGYKLTDPKRGDIVLFSPPDILQQQYKDALIKRIIGLPGETIEVKNGQVIINGEVLSEEYITEEPQYNWGPEVIPEKAYFVLGDNRNNSFDSHAWGFVSRDNIIGKATQIFWPPQRMGVIQ
jgi:signal peptidase I